MRRRLHYRWHRIIGYGRWRWFLRRTKHCRHHWHHLGEMRIQGADCCTCPQVRDDVS